MAMPAPIAPLLPPASTLISIMTAATADVTSADRRAIEAICADIVWATPDALLSAYLAVVTEATVVCCKRPAKLRSGPSGHVCATYHGARPDLVSGARERYHK